MIIESLLSAFPSVASFNDFKENDRDISRRAIPGIVRYALIMRSSTPPAKRPSRPFSKKTAGRMLAPDFRPG